MWLWVDVKDRVAERRVQKKRTHRIRPLMVIQWVLESASGLANRRVKRGRSQLPVLIYQTLYTLHTALSWGVAHGPPDRFFFYPGLCSHLLRRQIAQEWDPILAVAIGLVHQVEPIAEHGQRDDRADGDEQQP